MPALPVQDYDVMDKRHSTISAVSGYKRQQGEIGAQQPSDDRHCLEIPPHSTPPTAMPQNLPESGASRSEAAHSRILFWQMAEMQRRKGMIVADRQARVRKATLLRHADDQAAAGPR